MRRFTIIELMIVIAIMSILAGIALPMIYNTQLRAKKAEVVSNLNTLYTYELVYAHENGEYFTESSWHPDNSPGKMKRPWVSGSGFDEVGWIPDGDVYGSYRAFMFGWSKKYLVLHGFTDLDGDGEAYHCIMSLSEDAELYEYCTAGDVF